MIDILRSEWTKIRSVRSTMWTLAVTAGLMLGIGALIASAARGSTEDDIPGAQAVMLSLTGIMFASLSIATLGVLVISSEYRTGGIRTSLMAVPKRMSLLTGKIVVFTVTSLLVCTVASAASLAVGVAIIQPPSLDMGEAVRTVVGCGLYLTACGLFGLALGTLVRHTPGAIVSAIALMLVLPQITGMLPGQVGRTVADHFTTNAGMQVAVPLVRNTSFGPWSGFGVYLVWIAVTMIVGAVLMRRRDA
ncbi:ABC transporter permease subunit [Nonomuraea diastatica]|uniref:ABC transporter permease n=1 Tax=Nonomuraea diastatica TaxID=1848329 RepID=A0A4R4VYM1_9ACTN|nr:ABC transporter permease subunit [Nonomuraea diastatica]TDD11279.1 ABC transporter permease [Nonomuraea diastatica]